MSGSASGILVLLLALGVDGRAAEPGTFHFAAPSRLATASCTDFAWVSDLPLCLETARLLELAATQKFGLPEDRVDSWANGSSEEFSNWSNKLEEKGELDGTLYLYFVTHQLKDGSLKFSHGTDLPPAEMVTMVNRLARRYGTVVLINDCCYGATLEQGGRFESNIIRLYSSAEDEEAYHFKFDKGPYGLEKFLKDERAWMKQDMQWNPPGMTFLGIIGLKSALEIAKKPGSSVTLQTLLRYMSANRDHYDDSIRQKKVQHFVLAPPTADCEILTREKHEL